MDYEPSGPFITSVLELKLDVNTTFEWQKHSQATVGIPHYQQLLEFLNLRAHASETSVADPGRRTRNEPFAARKTFTSSKPIASFAASADDVAIENCILCKTEKHPLYVRGKFKSLSHDEMVSTLKSRGFCLNCMRPGHFV